MFGFIYSLVAYAAFLGVFNYFIFFTDGIYVPKHVDSGEPAGLLPALMINLGLLVMWGVQHSVMARQGFKGQLTKLVPKHLERSTFVLVSALTLATLMALWQPMGGVIWQVESAPAATALWVLNAVGWAGVPIVSFLIDHFDLFGVKQSFLAWRKRSYAHQGFVMPWLYRYVRHPMMVAFLAAFWACPTMTVSHLVLSVGLSIYILIGVHFEERSLARELGVAYLKYQATTPKLVPRLTPRKSNVAKAELG